MVRLTFLVVLIAVVAAPTASASQAGHTKGTTSDGSRASIKGSATVPSSGGVIATVRVQQALTTSAGMFQFGEIYEGASFASNCGLGVIGYMVERRPPSGTYICNAYFGGFGSQHKFSVLRAADGSGFSAYLDGNYFAGPYALGFPSEGVAIAVGEYNGSAPSNYDFVWGPTTGNTPWQNTIDYGANWNTVTNGAGIFNDGGWSVGPVPSPFHISR